MSAEGQLRPGSSKAEVIATVGAVLAAVVVTWGIREGSVRTRIDERIEQLTAEWRVDREIRLRQGRILERELRPLLANRRFGRYIDEKIAARRFSGQEEGEAEFQATLGKALESRGRGLLADADLAAFQALKKKMVFASEAACPCFWSGEGCTQANVVDGLSRLSDGELATWYGVSTKASLAALDAEGVGDPEPSMPTRAALQTGLSTIADSLAPGDRERFDAVLDGRRSAPEDRCFAARTMFSGLEALEPGPRARFTRALAIISGQQR